MLLKKKTFISPVGSLFQTLTIRFIMAILAADFLISTVGVIVKIPATHLNVSTSTILFIITSTILFRPML